MTLPAGSTAAVGVGVVRIGFGGERLIAVVEELPVGVGVQRIVRIRVLPFDLFVVLQPAVIGVWTEQIGVDEDLLAVVQEVLLASRHHRLRLRCGA